MDLNTLIKAAIKEDMPHGDATTDCLAQPPKVGIASLQAKEDIILSGITPFEHTLSSIEPTAKINWHFNDGDLVLNKQTICSISGDLLQILKAERIALNFIGHLSGIATLTQCFVKQAVHTQTKIIDTRKTMAGYRQLEKEAVIHGGGGNHRQSLSDAILIKENHIILMGGISAAVTKIRENTELTIEVEVDTLQKVKEAIELNVHRILLDNMDDETLEEALALIPSHIETEVSGNITIDRVSQIAKLGVNYISVGALTHSAPCADISLLFNWQTIQNTTEDHHSGSI